MIIHHLPVLSYSQAFVLALWSFGMIMAQSCGLSRVSQQVAVLIGQRERTVSQRLREWYLEKEAKTGKKRQEVNVTACFAPLLGWVLSWWAADEKRIALAIDATSLGAQFVVLSISVVYRGCAIPVAWIVLKAAQKGAWKDEWLILFRHLKEAIPPEWFVLVLADRGLYASWLFQAIRELHWHPFLRINLGGKFRVKGSSQFLPLHTFVSQSGSPKAEVGTCFKTNPIEATLLTCWESQYTDPWLVVCDLPVEQAKIAWYGMRAWIENGFKTIKRGGWQWQNTRIESPARATRIWLALTVGLIWTLSVGGEAEMLLPASSLPDLPPSHIARRRHKNRQRSRSISLFRRGIATIQAALANRLPIPLGRFYPEPWPT